MSEWSKEHAWKVCIRQKCIEGSNPSFSAKRAKRRHWKTNGAFFNKGQKVVKAYEVGRDSKVSYSQNKNREISITVSPDSDNIRIIAIVLNKKVMEDTEVSE